MLRIVEGLGLPMVPEPDAAELACRQEMVERASKQACTEDTPPSRRIRRFSSHQEMEDEDRRYWLNKSIAETMEETASLIRHAYGLMRIDVDAQRSDRTLVRVERTWR